MIILIRSGKTQIRGVKALFKIDEHDFPNLIQKYLFGFYSDK